MLNNSLICHCNICGPNSTYCYAEYACLIHTETYRVSNLSFEAKCLDKNHISMCKINQINSIDNDDIYCCLYDWCNSKDKLDLKMYKYIAVSLPIVLIVMSIITLYLLIKFDICQKNFYSTIPWTAPKEFYNFSINNRMSYNKVEKNNNFYQYYTTNNSNNITIGSSFSEMSQSVSNYSVAMLQARNLKSELELIKLIGQGAYGKVWLAKYHSTSVAVKIQLSRPVVWSEILVFKINWLIHKNILIYWAFDTVQNDDSTICNWIVTEYHRNGSLFNYLQFNSLDIKTGVNFIKDLIRGLVYLHLPITTMLLNKPAICHRDIKSCNVLVKDDGTLCLADLGFAKSDFSFLPSNDVLKKFNSTCRHDLWTFQTDNQWKVGTKRYMPPEILNGTMLITCFESFVKSDIYSLGLVIWEIINCIVINDNEQYGYCMPFNNLVPRDPSFEEMQLVVCKPQSIRPAFKTSTLESPLNAICQLVHNCWNDDPKLRINSADLINFIENFYI